MGMNRLSTYATDYETLDDRKDVGAVPTISTTQYRRLRRMKKTICSRCPPHRGENAPRRTHLKKKQWQINRKFALLSIK